MKNAQIKWNSFDELSPTTEGLYLVRYDKNYDPFFRHNYGITFYPIKLVTARFSNRPKYKGKNVLLWGNCGHEMERFTHWIKIADKTDYEEKSK